MTDKLELVIATSNPGKVKELRPLIAPSLRLLSLADLSLESPAETGQTFLDNAILKAEHASRLSKLPAIADDSGLEVLALDARPGVLSSRFAGPDATDEENNRKLMRELSTTTLQDRSARFCCAVAIHLPDGFTISAQGHVRGKIIAEPRGSNGFGYDPHFEVDDPSAPAFGGRTMAELSVDEKNEISHRSRAFRALIKEIRSTARVHPVLQALRCE